jgi:hypothetical protein
MRARGIKPGFFTNEELAECSAFARLLFPGLWMLADREGRLEDRPKRIRGEVFPYDDVDADALLSELEAHGFILRYEAGSQRFIQVVKFSAHQRPHGNERESKIPPCAEALTTMVESAYDHGDKDLLPRSKALRPDSLIPDSLTPDSASSLTSPADAADAEEGSPEPGCLTAGQLKEIWNRELAPLGFPCVSKATPARERRLRARVAEDAARASPRWWEAVMAKMAASPFMLDAARARKPWLCIDWLLSESNLVKVVEGRYEGRRYDANAPPRLAELRDPDEILRDYFGHSLPGCGDGAVEAEARPATGGECT